MPRKIETRDPADYALVESNSLDREVVESLLRDSERPRRFVGVDMSGADLSHLDLSNCCFERCVFIGTNFGSATLEATIWQRCHGAAANFRSSLLHDAEFYASDFNNGDWRHCRLPSALFEGCKLTGCDLTGASSLGLEFRDTLLVGASLPGFSFRKSVLQRIDFSDADLSDADFRGAVLQQSSLRNARLSGARFEQADIRGADLGGLDLDAARHLRGAVISADQAQLLLSEFGLTVL